MARSDSTGAIAGALAAAQAAFASVAATRTAKIRTKAGGEFGYSYADLASVINATRPALASNGLAVVQLPRVGDHSIVVTTLLLHRSGEWISEEMEWPVDFSDPRSIGSGITYARRYGYVSVTGACAADEDDDGQAARGGNHEQQRPATPKPPPKAKPDEVTAGLTRDITAHFDRLQVPVEQRKSETERLLGRRPKGARDLSELAARLAGLTAIDQRSSEQMGGA